MSTKTQWQPSAQTMDDYTKFNYIGILDVEGGDHWEAFEILASEDRLIFGGACNVGFLESGYMLRESYESLDESLRELHEDLETYYRDGESATNRIVCNECM
jgi:hypothetical protein